MENFPLVKVDNKRKSRPSIYIAQRDMGEWERGVEKVATTEVKQVVCFSFPEKFRVSSDINISVDNLRHPLPLDLMLIPSSVEV